MVESQEKVRIVRMTTKSAKRKATMALREVVQAARKYVRAEDELERVLREEKTQTHKEPVKCTV